MREIRGPRYGCRYILLGLESSTLAAWPPATCRTSRFFQISLLIKCALSHSRRTGAAARLTARFKQTKTTNPLGGFLKTNPSFTQRLAAAAAAAAQATPAGGRAGSAWLLQATAYLGAYAHAHARGELQWVYSATAPGDDGSHSVFSRAYADVVLVPPFYDRQGAGRAPEEDSGGGGGGAGAKGGPIVIQSDE